ncbi:MAG: orotidine-5'-phosphate decarboxylase [Candidatus Firestonebacteria bacterium]|nr:orotidine-5'-phosphate decarboxylase [Candidatus Firestonebacteria bacterium]
MQAKDKIIVALDCTGEKAALNIAEKVAPFVGVFKVGFELFISAGPSIVKNIHSFGGKVFLDLKLHDIPNTVAKAVLAAAELNIFMLNVHASGGREMMKQAAQEIKKAKNPPVLIGVTVLTSMTSEVLKNEINIQATAAEQVVRLAKLSKEAGLSGVVASGEEIIVIKNACGKDFKVVVPGVRPSWSEKNDQKRVVTPGEAIERGADFIVIGRPITGDKNPAEAAKKILAEIRQ